MTVFKAYLKVLNKNKFLVILYTVILVFFAGFNMSTSDNSTNFVASKPDVLIVNEDENKGITKNLISYIEKNSVVKEIEANEERRNDALFYRDVNYIIYIPKNFNKDFLGGKSPKIEFKSTGDYNASLASMMVERYLNVANIYRNVTTDEQELVTLINHTLEKEVSVEVTSKLDDSLEKAALFYNFANYSLLAGSVYVICFIIASFKEETIRKRTVISSMNDKKFNRILLGSNALFAFTLWLLYFILSIILIKDAMFSVHGLLFLLNSFVFTFLALTLALLIGNIMHNKEAINGIVNVIALGTSFLCGAFVPAEFLPDAVLKIAHILPSYYYIHNNELIASLEEVHIETLIPILVNLGIILLFSIFFIFVTNFVTRKKNQI